MNTVLSSKRWHNVWLGSISLGKLRFCYFTPRCIIFLLKLGFGVMMMIQNQVRQIGTVFESQITLQLDYTFESAATPPSPPVPSPVPTDNQIGDDGAKNLAVALRDNATVQEVDLASV